MIKRILPVQKRLWSVFVFLVLLTSAGCQFVDQPTSIVDDLQSALTQTAYPTQQVTLDATAPAATVQPDVTPEPATSLSLEAPWLAYPSGNGLAVVNQDGSGQTQFDLPQASPAYGPTCNAGDTFMLDENPANRMADFNQAIYLLQPPNAIRSYTPWFSYCTDFAFSRGGWGGSDLLLASIQAETSGQARELLIYELPSGKIRNRFPLVECASQEAECAARPRLWQVGWSPNGRYLAFPKISNGSSTDLYIYDSKDGSTRQLTKGPEEVAQFWWSPDGTWVIISEERGLRSAENYEPALWAVSVSSNEIRFLYKPTLAPMGILGWLDNENFLSYDGNISCCADLGRNLRLVNMAGNDARLLFDSGFVWADLDRKNKTVVVQAVQRPTDPKQSVYLVSIESGKITAVDSPAWETGDWNGDLNLYVTKTACQDQPDKVEAFDLNGKGQCVQPPAPTPAPTPETRPDLSPDQRWQVLLKVGEAVWLKNLNDLSVRPVTQDSGTQVIWCPDSTCFFLVSSQILYRVSMPELVMQKVDEGLGTDQIEYQWLAANTKK